MPSQMLPSDKGNSKSLLDGPSAAESGITKLIIWLIAFGVIACVLAFAYFIIGPLVDKTKKDAGTKTNVVDTTGRQHIALDSARLSKDSISLSHDRVIIIKDSAKVSALEDSLKKVLQQLKGQEKRDQALDGTKNKQAEPNSSKPKEHKKDTRHQDNKDGKTEHKDKPTDNQPATKTPATTVSNGEPEVMQCFAVVTPDEMRNTNYSDAPASEYIDTSGHPELLKSKAEVIWMGHCKGKGIIICNNVKVFIYSSNAYTKSCIENNADITGKDVIIIGTPIELISDGIKFKLNDLKILPALK